MQSSGRINRSDELNKKKYAIIIEFINDENINNSIIKFDIPILWNQCDKLLKKIKQLKINKKILLEHLNDCENCEIINNNLYTLELNKKIVIHYIKSKENYHIMDKIIKDYQNVKNFSDFKLNSDFTLDDNKINLICCFESNNIYNKCIFILHKLNKF